ncbi:YmfQ family protein [Paenibacillus doosanensis]|uniref:YmfQ family protein n=1 Tax=Paenibacillus doosanensis TaxID=1229154 RepID=UPI00217FDE29|nr:YmfQ family protein [Paenibacillus doosanensis]MCS7463372.1 YmfQ family protein [Paenibacillus doosanensis]
MGDYLPLYYRDSVAANGILTAESTELADLNAEISDVLAQYFVDTATWGLAHWERICGIATDKAKPPEQRRSVIKSKLRGIGTVTVSLIKNVAEAYVNGEVGVTEDNANYSLTITFISSRGIPPNLDDIQSVLRETIPAHLGLTFKFTYLIWSELDALGWTWDMLENKALTYDQLEVYKP